MAAARCHRRGGGVSVVCMSSLVPSHIPGFEFELRLCITCWCERLLPRNHSRPLQLSLLFDSSVSHVTVLESHN